MDLIPTPSFSILPMAFSSLEPAPKSPTMSSCSFPLGWASAEGRPLTWREKCHISAWRTLSSLWKISTSKLCGVCACAISLEGHLEGTQSQMARDHSITSLVASTKGTGSHPDAKLDPGASGSPRYSLFSCAVRHMNQNQQRLCVCLQNHWGLLGKILFLEPHKNIVITVSAEAFQVNYYSGGSVVIWCFK